MSPYLRDGGSIVSRLSLGNNMLRLLLTTIRCRHSSAASLSKSVKHHTLQPNPNPNPYHSLMSSMVSHQRGFSSKSENNIEDDSPPGKNHIITPEIKEDFDVYAEMIVSFAKKGRRANAADVEVIATKQLCHSVHNVAAVERNNCKHGFPRAFIQTPFGKAYNSGIIRLTCPHLVKEIDNLESIGGVKHFNSIFQGKEAISTPVLEGKARSFFGPLFDHVFPTNSDKTASTSADFGQVMLSELLKLNIAWRDLKRTLFSHNDEKEFNKAVSRLGESTAKSIRDSGFIGISDSNEGDVKCLHAHVADHLIRGDNSVGKLTLDLLEAKGVDTRGCDRCVQQCGAKIVHRQQAILSTVKAATTSNRPQVAKRTDQRLRQEQEQSGLNLSSKLVNMNLVTKLMEDLKESEKVAEVKEEEEVVNESPWFYLPRKNQSKLRIRRERNKIYNPTLVHKQVGKGKETDAILHN